MSYFLYGLSGILIILGVIGSVLPVLPGPFLSFAGITILYFLEKSIGLSFVFIFAAIMVLVTIMDYIIPIYGTKRFHGSRYGIWGSTIGVFAGFFYPPFGFIVGPFIGAFLGEILSGKGIRGSLKAALGSFIGFLAGTGLKLIYALVCAFYYIKYTL